MPIARVKMLLEGVEMLLGLMKVILCQAKMLLGGIEMLLGLIQVLLEDTE